MGAAGDQFRNFCIVIDVRESEAWLAIRNDVQQIQTTLWGNVARLNQPGDWRVAAFAIRSDRLFLDRGQPALGVSWSEAGVAHLFVVIRCFFDGSFQLMTKLPRDGSGR